MMDAYKLYPIKKHFRSEYIRVKYLTDIKVSNVDKKIQDDEIEVSLCNYVDVYYNEFIDDTISFLKATATEQECLRFQLDRDDVIITKDSESPDDIAVPACVTGDYEKLLCGYHLAIYKPTNAIYGQYLFRFLQSTLSSAYFETRANGITRFGVGIDAIGSLSVPLPPLKTQKAIARFLDKETKRIDKLIALKNRQIQLLQEKRSAIITQAVTKGLDPKVRMKDSGVEWIGKIPEGWEVRKLKYIFENLDNIRVPISGEKRALLEKTYPYYGASGIIDYVDDYLFDEPLILVAEDGANLLSRSTPLAFIARGKYWVNNHAHILKPFDDALIYWEAVLQTFDYTPLISGCAQPKLTAENLSKISLPYPPLKERLRIQEVLITAQKDLSTIIELIQQSITLLQEYRSSLITEAVTGKIDVSQYEQEE